MDLLTELYSYFILKIDIFLDLINAEGLKILY